MRLKHIKIEVVDLSISPLFSFDFLKKISMLSNSFEDNFGMQQFLKCNLGPSREVIHAHISPTHTKKKENKNPSPLRECRSSNNDGKRKYVESTGHGLPCGFYANKKKTWQCCLEKLKSQNNYPNFEEIMKKCH